jgi:hypothetical protein
MDSGAIAESVEADTAGKVRGSGVKSPGADPAGGALESRADPMQCVEAGAAGAIRRPRRTRGRIHSPHTPGLRRAVHLTGSLLTGRTRKGGSRRAGGKLASPRAAKAIRITGGAIHPAVMEPAVMEPAVMQPAVMELDPEPGVAGRTAGRMEMADQEAADRHPPTVVDTAGANRAAGAA